MESILKERYGELPNFFYGDDYENSYPVERRYDDAFLPALFGAYVSFDDASGHPFAVNINLSDEEILSLEVPDIENHPVPILSNFIPANLRRPLYVRCVFESVRMDHQVVYKDRHILPDRQMR